MTGRYRQITAEDGRVVAMAQSVDRRRILYVTADKLVRNPQAPPTLRGVVLHSLELPAMVPGGTVALGPDDVRRLAIDPTAAGFGLTIEAGQLSGSFRLAGDGDQLHPDPRPARGRSPGGSGVGPNDRSVVLTAAGVTAGPARPLAGDGRCHLTARPGASREGIATIEIVPAGRKNPAAPPLVLRPRFGAGLGGLSIP
jgi:hypothetical protein